MHTITGLIQLMLSPTGDKHRHRGLSASGSMMLISIVTEFDRQHIIVNDLLRERYDRWFVEFKDVIFPKDYDDDLVHMDMKERLRRNSVMRKLQPVI